jgi:hypothetical protein
LNMLVAVSVWLVIVLLFAGGYVAFLEIAKPQWHNQQRGDISRPLPQPESESSADGKGENETDVPKFTDWAQAGSSIAIVVLTVVIVFIYWRQTKVMAEQAHTLRVQASTMVNQTSLLTESLRVSRKALLEAEKSAAAAMISVRSIEATAERQLRAYLAIATQSDPVGSAKGGIFVSGDKISIHLFLKNCGQTPAYAVRDWCHIAVVEEPPKRRLPKLLKRQKDTTSVIAPGQAITIGREKRPGLSDREATLIKGGRALLYAYGAITYKDAFAKKRYITFRFRTTVTSGETDSLMISEKGNGAN